MEEQKKFDFNEAWEKIANRQNTNYLKLDVGIHNIFVLSEPELSFYTNPITNETNAQIELQVEYNHNQYLWTIPVGATEQSLYGQLMFLGHLDGTLIGCKLEVVVSTTKNHKGETIRKYQVLNYVRRKQQIQADD